MIGNWENRLLHCCGGESGGTGGVITIIPEAPLDVETAIPTYKVGTVFPIEIAMPMAIVTELRLARRRYQIADATQEVPVRIIEWMQSEPRYAKYFE